MQYDFNLEKIKEQEKELEKLRLENKFLRDLIWETTDLTSFDIDRHLREKTKS